MKTKSLSIFTLLAIITVGQINAAISAFAIAQALAEPITHKEHNSLVYYYSAAFSPASKYKATTSADGTVMIFDAATLQKLRTLKGKLFLKFISSDFSGHIGMVNFVTFSPNEQLIITAGSDGTAKIWQVAPGKLLRTLKGHTDEVWSAAFSPDGAKVATASDDKTVRIWNTKTGQEIHKLDHNASPLRFVVFSPDGTKVATTSGRVLSIWNTTTGQLVHSLEGHTNVVNSAAFSYDGKKIVTASDDNTAIIWDTESGEILKILKGHAGHVKSAVFSPNDKLIASGSVDKTIIIWDVNTGTILHTLKGHTDSVYSVAFSTDANLINTASYDGTVKIWNLSKIIIKEYFSNKLLPLSQQVLLVALDNLSRKKNDNPLSTNRVPRAHLFAELPPHVTKALKNVYNI